ncbi:uncharacterized protein RAG0_02181 [Rhynchosporium agropyri]|uniref:N-acetyltransferase domain-containing protein n=1 Tax=Rhynchosporium agropyri TaxID=914238 RepID=A0A1E1K0J6_9HELO|nr:uncharacterized protein RAG0_02181 [Rhynchosporium agropyri]
MDIFKFSELNQNLAFASVLAHRPLPPISFSTDPSYRHKLADISSRATLSDPLNILFQSEILGSSSKILEASDIYTSTLVRVHTKVALGSFIVEADDFAAVACWAPPASVQPAHTESELTELGRQRPVFAAFLRSIELARTECLGEVKFLQLSLMARDPERVSKGAVRGLLEWGLGKARREGYPVWCVAGNERARDVYAWLGFRVHLFGDRSERNDLLSSWDIDFDLGQERAQKCHLKQTSCKIQGISTNGLILKLLPISITVRLQDQKPAPLQLPDETRSVNNTDSGSQDYLPLR